MARTIVQSITVGILWATVITVQSANSVLIVFCRIMSVALSIDAVASSSTKILLFLNKARPRQNNCLCPILQFDPSSKTDESSPLPFSSTASFSWHFSNTSHIWLSVC
nr:hypothetical protein SOVF_194470 [Ipomoea batatas]